MAAKEKVRKSEQRASMYGPGDTGYGPGGADYITERPRNSQGVPPPGTLINPAQMYYDILGIQPTTIGVDRFEGVKRQPPTQIIPDKGNSLFRQQTANAGTVMNDAGGAPVAQKPQPKQTSTPKGDKVPPSTDPLTMMFDALADWFSGATPSPGMGGGTTTMPKDMFTEWPAEMYSGVSDPQFDAQQNDPNMSAIATALDPNAWAASQQQMAPPPVPARRPISAPASSAPPLPEPNPAFHDANMGMTMGSVGDLLNAMFSGGVPPMPARAPLPRGGI